MIRRDPRGVSSSSIKKVGDGWERKREQSTGLGKNPLAFPYQRGATRERARRCHREREFGGRMGNATGKRARWDAVRGNERMNKTKKGR